ncbi:MAG: reverse transcriptase/maturase family protein, partial [Minicystis sp.]
MSAAAPSGTWCGVAALAGAARACARRKRGRLDAIAFRLREGEEVLALAHRLEEGSYLPEPGRVFVTEHPKHREVHAAVYRDRVVHHLIHALLEPVFEPTFSEASFACRRGKGTHAAVRHLQARIWRSTRHGGVRGYALQMDVVNFFMSLHKLALLEMLAGPVRRLEGQLAQRLPPSGFGPWELCQRIVRHDPTAGAKRVGDLALFPRVPPHKRLGGLGPDRGIPIGNLTSQFFANVYLSPLDHFVQRTLGFGAYVRYVDDLVVLDTDAGRLDETRARIEAFLRGRLHLEVRAKPIEPVSAGVDFLGYVVRPRYLLPRRRVVEACRARLDEEARRARVVEVRASVRIRVPRLGPVAGPVRVTWIDEAACERLRAIWASY